MKEYSVAPYDYNLIWRQNRAKKTGKGFDFIAIISINLVYVAAGPRIF